jgi:hypothetical protein
MKRLSSYGFLSPGKYNSKAAQAYNAAGDTFHFRKHGRSGGFPFFTVNEISQKREEGMPVFRRKRCF